MNRIALLRKERNLKQKELGAIIGVAQNTVCNWENGKREPDHESLKELAAFFGCSIDYLLRRTDKREGKQPTPVTEDGLSEEQLEVIRRYEAAPPALRAAALAVLRSAEEQDKVQGDGPAEE